MAYLLFFCYWFILNLIVYGHELEKLKKDETGTVNTKLFHNFSNTAKIRFMKDLQAKGIAYKKANKLTCATNRLSTLECEEGLFQLFQTDHDTYEKVSNILRNKRSIQQYPRRARGQTQSQYLNFGDDKDEPGKAEAESTLGGSRAVVTGRNGMGQAQSQSFPFDCGDCQGRDYDPKRPDYDRQRHDYDPQRQDYDRQRQEYDRQRQISQNGGPSIAQLPTSSIKGDSDIYRTGTKPESHKPTVSTGGQPILQIPANVQRPDPSTLPIIGGSRPDGTDSASRYPFVPDGTYLPSISNSGHPTGTYWTNGSQRPFTPEYPSISTQPNITSHPRITSLPPTSRDHITGQPQITRYPTIPQHPHIPREHPLSQHPSMAGDPRKTVHSYRPSMSGHSQIIQQPHITGDSSTIEHPSGTGHTPITMHHKYPVSTGDARVSVPASNGVTYTGRYPPEQGFSTGDRAYGPSGASIYTSIQPTHTGTYGPRQQSIPSGGGQYKPTVHSAERVIPSDVRRPSVAGPSGTDVYNTQVIGPGTPAQPVGPGGDFSQQGSRGYINGHFTGNYYPGPQLPSTQQSPGRFVGDYSGNYQSHGNRGYFGGEFSGTYGPLPAGYSTVQHTPSTTSTGKQQLETQNGVYYRPGQGRYVGEPGVQGQIGYIPVTNGHITPGTHDYAGSIHAPGGVPTGQVSGIHGIHGQVDGRMPSEIGGIPAQYADNRYTGGIPTKTDGIPGQYTGTPGYTGGIPGQIGGIPGQYTGTPGQIGGVPGQIGGIPGQYGGTHGQNGGVPGQIGSVTGHVDSVPGQIGGAPGQIGSTTGHVGGVHGQISGVPGITGSIPGQYTGMHGYTGGVPGQIGGIPGQYGGTPGQITGVPGQISSHIDGVPGQIGAAPGQVGGVTGHIGGAPGQIGGAPGQIGSVTGHINGVPGKMDSTPGQYTDTSRYGGGIPGQINGIPEQIGIPGQYGRPGQISSTPAQFGGVPGQFNGVPGQYSGQPGQNGRIPGQYGGIPAQIGSTPGRIDNLPVQVEHTPGGIPGYVDPSSGQIAGRPGKPYPDGQFTRPAIYDTPQNFTEGTRYDDDANSEAQSSVQHIHNETQASASAQGRYEGGTADSQVSGTYSGSGSFSASAGTIDGKRGAQTQVSGGKKGAMSSSQATGGVSQSQSQVQLASSTGETSSSAQSGGRNHGTNTQVQAGVKGGMAGAEANGLGSTSSQAQIGFTPHDENEKSDQTRPFRGGGMSSAQSGTHTGQSQAQLQGKFNYGIRYTGSAQAGSGNNASLARNQTKPYGLTGKLPPLKPLNFTSDSNEEIPNVYVNKQETEPQAQLTETSVSNEVIETTELPNITTKFGSEDKTDDYEGYDYEESVEDTHLSQPNTRTLIKQEHNLQKQHIILDPLEDLDATVIQHSDQELPIGTILQPGQKIPGSPGFKIPVGFRGKVISVAGEHTSVHGENSQAQSVKLTPGSGRITYKKPVYTVHSNTQLRNEGFGYGTSYTYQPAQYNLKSGKSAPKFVSMTKTETGLQNINTGKKTPSVYYTQASTCGYFTNTCVYTGGKKICIPRPKTNPDGSPIKC